MWRCKRPVPRIQRIISPAARAKLIKSPFHSKHAARRPEQRRENKPNLNKSPANHLAASLAHG